MSNYSSQPYSLIRATPTAYQLQAAVLAARVLDPKGNSESSLRASYDRLATGGLYRSMDLVAGHALLQRAQLVRTDGTHHTPTPTLLHLCGMPDDVEQ